MLNADVIVTVDNLDKIKAQYPGAIAKALEMIGLQAEGYAKMKCPVDTGRLRNSITHRFANGEDAEYIGTNVEYGAYVELGTSKMAARPFLKPAATNHTSEYKAIFQSVLGETT